MTDITAASILSQNGYTITDIPLLDVETIIDDCIDTVNSDADIYMPNMAGTAGSKTVTVTGKQNAALKPLIASYLREYKKTSLSNSASTSGSSSTNRSASIAGVLSTSQGGSVGNAISATSSINSSANSIYLGMYTKAIARLREMDVSLG
jgi:hypothetical protein